MEAAREHLLFVDDEPQVLVALEDLFHDRFVVLTSTSAERALELVEQDPEIAVVVTDQRMPRMTGDELLAKLGQSCPASRIMVTGFADLSAVIRAVNDGRIFAYVTKPWNPEDLQLKVDKAVEHFRLSQDLAHERRLLRDLMENVPDAIYFKDADLRFLRANDPFVQMTNCDTPDGLVGNRLADVLRESETASHAEREERLVVQSGRPVKDVVREYRHDGKVHWYSETRAPVKDPTGAVVGLVGISRDVTERVATQNALRASEERYRAQTQILNSILDGMWEGVVVADRAGKLLVFNRRAETILGVSGHTTAPADWGSAYGAYLADQKTPVLPDKNPLLQAMTNETTVETELFVRHPAGSGIMVAVAATPLRNDSGETVGGIAVLRDVTRQRQLEEQLMQSQKLEAIGRLAGGVAHDFNNLLAVIVSYGDLLAREFQPGDPAAEDLGEMLAAANRAAALTRQLLAFSRRQVLQPRPLNLNEIVTNAKKMLQRIIGEDIELVTALAHDLGMVLADPGQVEQIILNFTVNSRDAMPEGGTLTVQTDELSVDAAYSEANGIPVGDFVVLTVSDSGIGMDADTKGRIFEPFFTTKAAGEGTGLGLSTVSGIVQQNGGHIRVDSEVGAGTTFSVYLPKIAGRADAPGRAAVRTPQPRGSGTILLVEDDEAVRRIAVKILRRHGYTVLDARRATDALKISSEAGSSLDLLLTDVIMPGTSGPKLADELSARFPKMRRLYMSGYSAHDSVIQQGAACLAKPFTPASLLEKVREVFSSPPPNDDESAGP